jgi:DNA-binding MarR family transcriptional regulator
MPKTPMHEPRQLQRVSRATLRKRRAPVLRAQKTAGLVVDPKDPHKNRIAQLFEWIALLHLGSKRRVEAAVRPSGLTFPQLGALYALAHTDGLSQRELGSAIHADRTTVMVIVDGLARKGLAERTRDPADRRRNIVRLTEEGRRVFSHEAPRVEGLYQPLLDEMSSRQLDALCTRLAQVAEALDIRFPAAGDEEGA